MKTLRCAIYSRKSSEEGLDQSFNSLDAQREACAAYIVSQKGEGWKLASKLYDDGGFSGGNMERPGLVSLLRDIGAGLIDVVVVYKVDRLTRSLPDFARIVDQFDRKGVSFVSVTQAFNTTTSMGRLTLNVLLSFAQFEREVTGERIRDKIAQSKAKGMWMGGAPPLGYAGHERTLKIIPDEAATVRHIFVRYLELGSVHTLKLELEHQGVTSKVRVSGKGNRTGGLPINRGALFHMLRNPIYVGDIPHRDKVFPGLHEPIIDRPLFQAVGVLLAANGGAARTRRQSSPSLLTGLLKDVNGRPMSPVATSQGDRTYRYYVSTDVQRGEPRAGKGRHRVVAHAIETAVVEALREVTGDQQADWLDLRSLVASIMLIDDSVRLMFGPGLESRVSRRSRQKLVETSDGLMLTLSLNLTRRGGRSWMTASTDAPANRRRIDKVLVAGLRRAHRELRQAGVDVMLQKPAWREMSGINDPYIRKLVRLAFLAPDIQQAIMDGQQPVGLTLQVLRESDIPSSWDAQRRTLGFTQSPAASCLIC